MKKSLKNIVEKLSDEERDELYDYLEETEKEMTCRKMAKVGFGSKELRDEFKKLKSVWSDESRIRTYATIQILDMLEQIKRFQNGDKRL